MALAEEARARQQHTFAGRLARVIDKTVSERAPLPMSRLPASVSGALAERKPRLRFRDLVLSRDNQELLTELRTEHEQADLLYSHSLQPRRSVLLVGPPGNGKTSLAEAIAAELGVSFYALRYEGVVGSFLGETAAKLSAVMEYASSTPCVLFFDEFDAVGKERGDIHETGEIKRVVSSLLMQFDALPPHVVLVCATNHPELLDRAVWRRFEVRLDLPNPSRRQLKAWFERAFPALDQVDPTLAGELSEKFRGKSFAEAEQFSLDVQRRLVLSEKRLDEVDAIRLTVKRWKSRLASTRQKNGHRASDPNPDLFERDEEG
ncbi:AAA family ATPase [Bosea massiliensis]|uniref:AAA family ATPase n=1 Tax=Bosea massiliensis TaxID=151419 RepID=A0ABW0P1Y2_9HYPH